MLRIDWIGMLCARLLKLITINILGDKDMNMLSMLKIFCFIVLIFIFSTQSLSFASTNASLVSRDLEEPQTYGELFKWTFKGKMNGESYAERTKRFWWGTEEIESEGSANMKIKPSNASDDALRVVLFIEDVSYADKDASKKMPSSFTVPVTFDKSIINAKIKELKVIDLQFSDNDENNNFEYHLTFQIFKDAKTFKMRGKLEYLQESLPGGIPRKDVIRFDYNGSFSEPDYLD